ncbi:DUF11 domain-containing protein [Brevibacillus humidisoli]|uniref:choice-of-anchor Q domain-containing protein n=1 Tax=Brevibacillus humidisoli TaxID=2895522 RepID=UPI001E44A8BF|nr:choice-of-anchor Q domain-containing protein [Brevibacillus humidisoli]UFJ39579.1 DUF11 domain-containing protein [Brevibacillus humidisoli]
MLHALNRLGTDMFSMSFRAKLFAACVGIGLALLFGFSVAAEAATHTVTDQMDTVDSNPGDGVCQDSRGQCTLRAAIMESNASAGADTIILPEGTYTLTLAGTEDGGDEMVGDLDVLDDLTIIGAGGSGEADPTTTIIQAGTSAGTGIDRVLAVNPNVDREIDFTLKAVWIRYGKSKVESFYGASLGGGILADAANSNLYIYNTIISDNEAGNDGGGLYLSGLTNGTIRVEKSEIRQNKAGTSGGGIIVAADSSVEIVNSTIDGNTAGIGTTFGRGGGIRLDPINYGTVKGAMIEQTTISNNQVSGSDSLGGGVASHLAMTMENATISGNRSDYHAGGVYIETSSPSTITNITITDNRADADGNSVGDGGGLYLDNGDVTARNTIIAKNYKGTGTAASDVFKGSGTFNSTSSYNLIGVGGSGGLTNSNSNLINVSDPGLGPLADNGGPTKTHALLNGSPAIEAGSNAWVTTGSTDQHGRTRILDSADTGSTAVVDIGAVEAHPTIQDIGNQTIGAGGSKQVTFEVGDDGLGFDSITATSNNQTLLPDSNLTISGSGSTRNLSITPASGQMGTATITVKITDDLNGVVHSATDTFDVEVVSSADLTVAKTDNGPFYQGQTGAQYRITVSNEGAGPTSGTVTVTDTLPAGLAVTSISGESGESSIWHGNCSLGTLTCTTSTVLAAGESYEDIVVTVDVANNAPANVTNAADVTGGADVDTTNNHTEITTTVNEAPAVADVDVPANGSYLSGDPLDFTVHFTRPVTVTGTPRLELTIGSGTRYATYQSAVDGDSLSFRYMVAEGDLDSDGIALAGAIDLNGGTIRDASTSYDARLTLNGVEDLSQVLVDAVKPTVNSVTVPANGTYGTGAELDFTVELSEPVTVTGTPEIPLIVGGTTRYASYIAVDSDQDSLVFRYAVQSGDHDSDGVALGGSIELAGGSSIDDAVGNAANLTLNNVGSTAMIYVDTSQPEVAAVEVPAADAYKAGENLDFTIRFSKIVTVDTAGGTPRLVLDVGGSQVYANYQSGTNSDELTFRYTVGAGQNDADGIAITALEANGGTIQDAAGNASSLVLQNVSDTSGILIDTQVPTVQSIVIPTPGTYLAGGNLDFAVTYDEPVSVDTTGGTPYIPLDVGGANVQAAYVSAVDSTTLTFRYQIEQGRKDENGIEVTGPIAINGGSITDTAQNNADAALNGLGDTSGILVDAVAPTITGFVYPAAATYKEGDTLTFTPTFSESVLVDTSGGRPRIELTIGSSTRYAEYTAGHHSTALTFTYQVQDGEVDVDGIDVAGSIDLNGGTLQDSIGNSAELNLPPAGTSGILVDAADPTVTSVSITDGYYYVGDTLQVIVNLSEPVTVNSGTPALELDIGGTPVQADYQAGTRTNALAFAYNITPGLEDHDGIELGAAIQLNGSMIRDAVGNEAVPTLPATDTSNVRVDTSEPEVTSVDLPADGFYKAGDDLDFTVHFDEPVTVSGTPRLALEINRGTIYADYQSGSNTDELLFRYTVQPGDDDRNGLELLVPTIDLNGGTIQDASGLAAFQSLNNLNGDLSAIYIDTTGPAAPSFTTHDGTVFRSRTATFTGTGEPDSTVRLYVDGDTSASASGKVRGDGTWRISVSGLTVGDHQIEADAVDEAGNESSGRDSIDFTIKNPPPPPPPQDEEWPEQEDVPVDKSWTIRFSKKLDPETVTERNIYVTDDRGRHLDVEVTLGEDEKSILVSSPEEGYEPGETYTLHIRRYIRSEDGESLKKSIRMDFTIAEETVGPQDSSSIITVPEEADDEVPEETPAPDGQLEDQPGDAEDGTGDEPSEEQEDGTMTDEVEDEDVTSQPDDSSIEEQGSEETDQAGSAGSQEMTEQPLIQ